MKLLPLAAIFLIIACSAENTAVPVVSSVGKMDNITVAEVKTDDTSDNEISLVSHVVDYNADELMTACVRDALETEGVLGKKGRFAVAVYDKKVFVIGGISENEMIENIPSVASSCEGIAEINNLVVFDKYPFAKSFIGSDKIIYDEIMKKLADDSRVDTENYRIAVYKGKIYVVGIASSKKEQRDVFRIIRRVNGITNIINYIGIKK